MNEILPAPTPRKPRKYEYKASDCARHGNRCAMRRERGVEGPFECVFCANEATAVALLDVALTEDLAPAALPVSEQSPPATPAVEAASPADATVEGAGACACWNVGTVSSPRIPNRWCTIPAHAAEWAASAQDGTAAVAAPLETPASERATGARALPSGQQTAALRTESDEMRSAARELTASMRPASRETCGECFACKPWHAPMLTASDRVRNANRTPQPPWCTTGAPAPLEHEGMPADTSAAPTVERLLELAAEARRIGLELEGWAARVRAACGGGK